MKIGLLADTHDRLPAVVELLRRFEAAGVTLVMHAGDFCAPFVPTLHGSDTYVDELR